jgi:hypothetical protein
MPKVESLELADFRQPGKKTVQSMREDKIRIDITVRMLAINEVK